MSFNKSPRTHSICEPEIHESLDWNMDLIVACMEVIRRKLPQLLDLDTSKFEFDLVSLENPHGPPYPVIGIHSPNDDYGNLPHFLELSELVTKWVESVGLDSLKNEASFVTAPSWTELKKAGHIKE